MVKVMSKNCEDGSPEPSGNITNRSDGSGEPSSHVNEHGIEPYAMHVKLLQDKQRVSLNS
jgi:hypothetical protein